MLTYILTTGILLLFFLLLFYSLKNLWINWRKLLFALVAIILTKIPFFCLPFFGLEYEDSFIFNVVARQFSIGLFTNSLFTEGVICGSLMDPIFMGEFSGHYNLFSVLGSWAIRIFGYSPYTLSYLNIIISFFILLILIDFQRILKLPNQYWWIIPSIFLLSPIINTFNSTQLSETFSSLLILTVIYSSVRFYQSKGILNILLLLLAVLSAILTKRENNIILFYFLLVALLSQIRSGEIKLLLESKVLILICLIIFVVNISIGGLNDSVIKETDDIGASAFSLKYFFSIFPVFAKSLFSFRYFTIVGVMIIASIVILIVSIKNYNIWVISATMLSGAYLVLYSIHFRSYYFVHYNDIELFDTFRYITNIFPLISLFVGFNISILLIKHPQLKKIFTLVIIPLIAFSILLTYSERRMFQEDEYRVRFSDACSFLDSIKVNENDILITSEPFIYQILADEGFNVLDLVALHECQDYLNENQFEKVYYLKNDFNSSSHFQKRYQRPSKLIRNMNKVLISEFETGSELYEVQ